MYLSKFSNNKTDFLCLTIKRHDSKNVIMRRSNSGSSTSSAAEEAAASSDHVLGLTATFFFNLAPFGSTGGKKESQLSREVVISLIVLGCSDGIKVGGDLITGVTNVGFLPQFILCRHAYRNTMII